MAEPGDGLKLGVVRHDTGQLIGDVLLMWTSEQHSSGEIGYMLHPRHQGCGYATEACQIIIRFAFENREWHRVTAALDSRNLASINVLHRLGMREEARFVRAHRSKGEWTTELRYAVLHDEWNAG